MAKAAPETWGSGCEHYTRFCKFVSPCCGEIYSCRICHDENEDHTLDRYKVSTVLCSLCTVVQPVQAACRRCGISFGEYYCLRCRLFDKNDKGQFHCVECGLCRVGGKSNYFHCKKCNLCLNVQLISNHTCVENASRSNCPVCIEDIHTSRLNLHVPPCGHLLHKACLEELKKANRTTCPMCQTEY